MCVSSFIILLACHWYSRYSAEIGQLQIYWEHTRIPSILM
jgi:hypothetical protein